MTEGNVVYEPSVSLEALAHLGEGHIAYVKQVRSEDVPDLFPQAPKIAPGLKLFALHAADGTPIMLTDSREAAIANAWSNELQAVSVHWRAADTSSASSDARAGLDTDRGGRRMFYWDQVDVAGSGPMLSCTSPGTL